MSDETITAEIVETTEASRPAVPPQAPPNGPLTLFGTTDPDEIIEAASKTAEALTKILEERHLYAVMGQDSQGNERRHVQIEGWALLGSMTGVFASTTWTREILDPKTGKALGWEARAEATTLAGNLVGAAEAECRWAEDKWNGRDSYAVKSMAQTRAQSKALAMPLRFIVELAGFNGTPAEEMVRNGNAESETEHKCPACSGDLWDNRKKNEEREAKGQSRMPEYKCRNRVCVANEGEPWITWDAHHFLEPSIRAKQKLTDLVIPRKNLWKLYYPLDDPSYPEEEQKLIASIHESDDGAQMAGKLWVDTLKLCHPVDVGDEHQLRRIVATAKIVLERIGEDAEDLVTLPEAWEAAEEQMAEADADAAAGTDNYH